MTILGLIAFGLCTTYSIVLFHQAMISIDAGLGFTKTAALFVGSALMLALGMLLLMGFVR